MRTGRYSYNAQQRSILRPIKKVQKLAEGFAQNYDCAIIRSKLDDEQALGQISEQMEKITVNTSKNASVISSSSVMEITTRQELLVAFYRACNTIFAQNGTPRLVNVSFVWPTDSEETFMAELTGYLAELCKCEQIELGSVTASVSSFVQKGFVTISAVGFVGQVDADFKLNVEKSQSAKKNQNAEKEQNSEKKKTLAGSTLCIAGHAGMAGIGLLASAGEEALTKQYTQGFIRQAQTFLDELSLRPIKEALEEIQTTIYPIQEGGVLTALWNFADGIGVGLDVDMKKILIRQESVEISEFYDINPYQLLGDGACLIATREPEKVCAALAQAGIKSQAIGQITDQNAKIIRRDDEVRYLDKPAQDEFERRKSESTHELL